MHAHLLQFSGAIWYPMVYELPQAAKTRVRQAEARPAVRPDVPLHRRPARRRYVFPIAGPPCFLDDELWQFNDIFGDEGNIFPDQSVFIGEYAKVGGTNGVVLLPGTRRRASTADDVRRPRHPVPTCDEFFAHKEEHLRGDARAQARR